MAGFAGEADFPFASSQANGGADKLLVLRFFFPDLDGVLDTVEDSVGAGLCAVTSFVVETDWKRECREERTNCSGTGSLTKSGKLIRSFMRIRSETEAGTAS